MGSQKKIVMGLGLVAFFLTFGTTGYMQLEDYSLLDAFYMTVITVSTVGYGEINELTGIGRIFTVFLILSGVGSVAFAAHAFTESLLEKAANPNLRKKAMKKKIANLNGHYIICGHGRVGEAAAEQFSNMEAAFVVIEESDDELNVLEEKGYLTVKGDATSEKVLLSAGIKKADALLALLDSDPENLFTVLTARELNPTLKIIARTEVASSENRILRAGADSVISPYASAGKRVATKILHATRGQGEVMERRELRNKPGAWLTVTPESKLAENTIGVAENKIESAIAGVRRKGQDYLLPDEGFQLHEGDELLLMQGTLELPESQREPERKRIVLVDDNPVIRRLYTRLFQKAGYEIYTAENGTDGVELITNELPHAAVIDFMLPDISGLEVCQQLRENEQTSGVRLVLFTADDQEETRKRAMRAGVETVVVKSPEATEIISIVKETLT